MDSNGLSNRNSSVSASSCKRGLSTAMDQPVIGLADSTAKVSARPERSSRMRSDAIEGPKGMGFCWVCPLCEGSRVTLGVWQDPSHCLQGKSVCTCKNQKHKGYSKTGES